MRWKILKINSSSLKVYKSVKKRYFQYGEEEWENGMKQYYFEMNFGMICYRCEHEQDIIFRESLNLGMADERICLADAAARLLILLYDIGIVKFGGENEKKETKN